MCYVNVYIFDFFYYLLILKTLLMVDSAPTIPSSVFEGNFRGWYLYDWINCMRVMLIQFPTDRCFAKSRTDAIDRLDLVYAVCHTNIGIRTACRQV